MVNDSMSYDTGSQEENYVAEVSDFVWKYRAQ
jgi:hypothetical protein